MFSKSESPLRESLLKKSSEALITRTGDLILVPSSDLCVTLNDDLWQHVGLVIHSAGRHVFIDGQLIEFERFIDEYRSDEGLYIRQLDRPVFLDKQVLEWTRQVSVIMNELDLEPEFYEGFAVGALLVKLKCCLEEEVHRGRLRPHHFSSETPFKRLQIRHYSDNIYFC